MAPEGTSYQGLTRSLPFVDNPKNLICENQPTQLFNCFVHEIEAQYESRKMANGVVSVYLYIYIYVCMKKYPLSTKYTQLKSMKGIYKSYTQIHQFSYDLEYHLVICEKSYIAIENGHS
jgi:uncharacterized membrane protein